MSHLNSRRIISLCLLFSLLLGDQFHAGGSETTGIDKWLAALHDKRTRINAAYDFRPLEPITGETITALVAALNDQDPFVRSHVAGALGELGGETDTVVPALINALQDGDESVREQAAVALGKLGAASVPSLIPLLSKADGNTGGPAEYAALALKQIGSPAFSALLKIDEAKPDPNDKAPCKNSTDLIEEGGRLAISNPCPRPERKYAQYLLRHMTLSAASAVQLMQGSPDRETRLWAIVALGNNGQESEIAVPALTKVLYEDDSQLTSLALEALEKYGDKALPALTSALKNRNPSVRLSAVETLARLEANNTARPLAIALKDRDQDVRERAAYALGALGRAAKETVPTLIIALKDPQATVRAAAADALGSVGKDDAAAVNALTEALDDKDWLVRFQTVRALASIGTAARPAILKLYALWRKEIIANEYITQVRMDDIIAVDKQNPSITAALIKDLFDPEPHLAASAARALGIIGKDNATVVTALIKALNNSDSSVRSSVIMSLGQLGAGASEAIPALASVLEKDEKLSEVTLNALGKMGADALPALLEAYRNPDPKIRRYALAQLDIVQAKDARVIATLIEALKDTDAESRRSAANLLGASGDAAKASIPTLIGLLKDPNRTVRAAAITALGEFGAEARIAAPDILPFLNQEGSREQAAAIIALFKIGAGQTEATQVVFRTLRKLGDDRYAYYLPVDFSDDALILTILNALRTGDASTRRGAVTVLFRLRHLPEESIPILIAALSDADAGVRLPVIEALKRTSVKPGVAGPALVQALNDEEGKVRRAAAEALFDFGYDPAEAGLSLNTVIYDKFTHEYFMESLAEMQGRGSNKMLFLKSGRRRARRKAPKPNRDRYDYEIHGYPLTMAISDAAATAPDFLPPFPWWPPPRFSAWYVVPQESFASQNTLADVHRRISSALSNMGYTEQGLFEVPDGFALVTKVERIYEDGKWYSPPDRWTNCKLKPHSMYEYLAHLWVEPPGHFRLFMFVVTTYNNLQGNGKPLSEESARDLFSEGGRVLPDEIGNVPFSNHNCHVVIYHFEKKNGITRLYYDDPLDATTHLKQSGLWNHLSR